MKIRRVIQSVAVVLVLASCSSSPAVTTSDSITSALEATSPASTIAISTKLSTTAITTKPVTIPSPVPMSTTPTTTSKVSDEDDLAQQILTIFKDGYGSQFDVELNYHDYCFTPTGEDFIASFSSAVEGKKEDIDRLGDFLQGLTDVTKSLPEELREYKVSVVNPVNDDNILFEVEDGKTLYSFLDELEPIEEPDIYTNGVYLVNDEIEPGLYKVDPAYGYSGYVARLSDTDMELDSILANETFDGPGYVQIKKKDKAVELSRVDIWKINIDDLSEEYQKELSDGLYLVGIDIEPGSYKVIPDDDRGYVARLDSVDMEMDSIIANEIYNGQGYVTIKKSDFAVSISRATLIKK